MPCKGDEALNITAYDILNIAWHIYMYITFDFNMTVTYKRGHSTADPTICNLYTGYQAKQVRVTATELTLLHYNTQYGLVNLAHHCQPS